MSNFHTIKIKEIKRQTPKAVEVTLDIPENLKEDFKHEAGQYLTFEKELKGHNERRSYSISSHKAEDKSVVVKAIENGVFSNYVNSELKAGDTLDVHPPEGFFKLPENIEGKNFIAFAAGSGITPIMSMIKHSLSDNDSTKFVLVYGNKSPESTIYINELLELQKEYNERFFIEFVYSETKEDNATFGRIEKPTINYVVKNKYKSIDFSNYFLCGPEEMIDQVKNILLENDIAEEKINFELFFSAEDAEPTEAHDGSTQIKVILDDEEFEFTMQKDERVLNAVLNQDIDAPYSCKGGICSSCVAKITEGEVEMVKNQILTDEDLDEGLVLTCQSLPKTGKITIDYDDI